MDALQVIDTEQERKEIIRYYRRLLRSYKPKGETKENKIRRAFDIALEAHKGIRRKSGELYIFHPLAVAQIVVDEIGLGGTSIICAILHDVVEDTEITLEDIKNEFGDKVAEIIDGLTKIAGGFDVHSSNKAENIKKILLTLGKDVRIILIKLADRLHNMRTMDSMARHKQLKIAAETLYVYIPLAHRLGFYNIKSELEDLCMKYMEPNTYRDIAKRLNQTKRSRTRYVNEFIRPLKKELQNKKLNFTITGRPKTIASIWYKMKTKNVSFEEVYDKFAVRIIVESDTVHEKADCWRVYSVITDIYRPNPDRLRDWISTPKANGYEALHTTVMGPKGQWVEIQIRSKRMNDIAEKGYAAHWKYKDNGDIDDSSIDKWLNNVRELLENPNPNTFDFLDNVTLNLFADEIYVFTPKGEVKTFPANATVLDFAYDIHTDIGDKCIGAKVNHAIVPPSFQLTNGDQVRVLTAKNHKANEDSLNYVITAKARTKIKDALKRDRKFIIEKGEKTLQVIFNKMGLSDDLANKEELVKIYHLENLSNLYYLIGLGEIDVKKISKIQRDGDKFIPSTSKKITGKQISLEKTIKDTLLRNANVLMFGEGSQDVDYYLANCCKPIPGDDVFGFVNVNNDVEVHKTTCAKTSKLLSKYDYKIVKTKWTKESKIAFLTALKITGTDDVGIMYNITKVISNDLKMNMRSITIDGKDGMFEGKIMVYVDDTEHLQLLMDRLKEIKGVLYVTRLDNE